LRLYPRGAFGVHPAFRSPMSRSVLDVAVHVHAKLDQTILATFRPGPSHAPGVPRSGIVRLWCNSHFPVVSEPAPWLNFTLLIRLLALPPADEGFNAIEYSQEPV